MRFLNQFFDEKRFFEGKRLQVIACNEWKDFDTKQHRGIRVDTVIVSDKTQYKVNSNGTSYNNLFEKITFKVERDITIPVGALVMPVNAVVSVYGDRYDKLSITCADLKVIAPPKE